MVVYNYYGVGILSLDYIGRTSHRDMVGQVLPISIDTPMLYRLQCAGRSRLFLYIMDKLQLGSQAVAA